MQPVGADHPTHVDVRVLAATNRDLEEEVRKGRFRADLLHRLDVYRVHVPSLRERPDDVPLLVDHVADRARRRLGVGSIRFSSGALEDLARRAWPGNVRELGNVISRAVLRAAARVAPGDEVSVDTTDLDERGDSARRSAPTHDETVCPTHFGTPLREGVREYQRQRIQQALGRSRGNWAAAARELGMDRSNLYHLAQRLGLR